MLPALQDLQALLDQELALHRQIHTSIWAAVTAMERWSSGVSRWQAKVTRDMNAWMAANAAAIAASRGSARGMQCANFTPIPLPPELDLSNSLRPPSPPAQQQQHQQVAAAVSAAMGEFGAAVVVTAAAGGADRQGGVRAAAGLGLDAAERPGRSSEAAAAPAAATGSHIRASRPSDLELPGISNLQSGGYGSSAASAAVAAPAAAAPWQHRLAAGQGSSSIRSPGGISLRSRTPGPQAANVHHDRWSHLDPPGADGSSSSPDSTGCAAAGGRPASAAAAAGARVVSGSGSRRARSASHNQVAPLDSGSAMAASAASPCSCAAFLGVQHSNAQGGAASLLGSSGFPVPMISNVIGSQEHQDGGVQQDGAEQPRGPWTDEELLIPLEGCVDCEHSGAHGPGRLPTISGRAGPHTKLQPL